jgi:hypothetical protein
LSKLKLVTGDGIGVPGWDSAWRGRLLDDLEPFVRQLWQVGVERIFVNGSFATRTPHPGDIDAYFESSLADYPRTLMKLLELEPVLPWDLTRRPIDPKTGDPKPVMWHLYRVEIFPHFTDYPSRTGIFDEYGNELDLPAMFRRDETSFMTKGLVRLTQEG